MPYNFLETTPGDTGLKVHRLGLSASYWPGKKTIYNAIDKGINYFFGYGFDNQMISVLRDVFKKVVYVNRILDNDNQQTNLFLAKRRSSSYKIS